LIHRLNASSSQKRVCIYCPFCCCCCQEPPQKHPAEQLTCRALAQPTADNPLLVRGLGNLEKTQIHFCVCCQNV
jgi:hypothetical protein